MSVQDQLCSSSELLSLSYSLAACSAQLCSCLQNRLSPQQLTPLHQTQPQDTDLLADHSLQRPQQLVYVPLELRCFLQWGACHFTWQLWQLCRLASSATGDSCMWLWAYQHSPHRCDINGAFQL